MITKARVNDVLSSHYSLCFAIKVPNAKKKPVQYRTV